MMMMMAQVVEINERKKDLLSTLVGSIVEEGNVRLSDRVSQDAVFFVCLLFSVPNRKLF